MTMACDREEDAFALGFAGGCDDLSRRGEQRMSVRREGRRARSAPLERARRRVARLASARHDGPAAGARSRPPAGRTPPRGISARSPGATRSGRLEAARARAERLGGAGQDPRSLDARRSSPWRSDAGGALPVMPEAQATEFAPPMHSLHHGHAHRVVNAPLRRVHGEHRVERERLGAVPRVLSDPNERARMEVEDKAARRTARPRPLPAHGAERGISRGHAYQRPRPRARPPPCAHPARPVRTTAFRAAHGGQSDEAEAVQRVPTRKQPLRRFLGGPEVSQ